MTQSWQKSRDAWNDFWFAPRDPGLLSVVRVGAGLVAIAHFALILNERNEWFGTHGWLDVDAGLFLIGNEAAGTGSQYRWSLLYWYPASVSWIAALGLFASVAVVAGIGSRLSTSIVWFCLATFHHRAPLLVMLHEPLLAAFMAYLTIDSGRTQWTLRPGLHSGGARVSVNIVLKLILCHFWIWIAFSLSSMLAHAVWWNGEASWLLMQKNVGWIQLPDSWQWLAHFFTHSVIAVQAAALFCMTQRDFHWIGRWMIYLFLMAVLLLLGDWMYASILWVASLAVWPIHIPLHKTEPS